MAKKKTQKLSRDEMLTRAAKVRAAILSLLGKRPGLKVEQVNRDLGSIITRLKGGEQLVSGQLRALYASGEVAHAREGRSYVYYHKDHMPKPMKTAKTPPQSAKAPAVQTIKVTGPVRLLVGNLVIDIGVRPK